MTPSSSRVGEHCSVASGISTVGQCREFARLRNAHRGIFGDALFKMAGLIAQEGRLYVRKQDTGSPRRGLRARWMRVGADMQKSRAKQLVCPETLEPLRLEADASSGSSVLEGNLVGPRGIYPIQQGIPSFVRAESTESQTVKSFAQKWSAHRYYRKQTTKFYTRWFLDRYGFFELANLREFLSGTRFVLDAGTGSGRDAAYFAENSDATVFGVDIALAALQTARRDVDHARVCFVHADINRLPFPDEFFDFINCDQVIHHTEDPHASFESLRRKLRPGGQICCYVYRKKAAIREFTDDFVRNRIRELPAEDALQVCEGITHLGRVLANMQVYVDIEEDIPILGLRKGRVDLQRFFHWNILKCFWNNDFDFFTNNIINFDWYHPELCHRFEPDEFRAWFADGWTIEAWDVQEAGISCRARKV